MRIIIKIINFLNVIFVSWLCFISFADGDFILSAINLVIVFGSIVILLGLNKYVSSENTFEGFLQILMPITLYKNRKAHKLILEFFDLINFKPEGIKLEDAPLYVLKDLYNYAKKQKEKSDETTSPISQP